MRIFGFIVNRNRIKDKSIFIYILFIIIIIFFIANKRNMHIDEVLTYGLANDMAGWMMPANGQVYSPAVSAWMEYVTVEDDRFDYHMVWNNQAGDVHPPLYMFWYTQSALCLRENSVYGMPELSILFLRC